MITFIITLKKYTYKSENLLMIPFHTNHSHKKKSYIIIIMSINIFVVINQINKHKVKIYNNCTYTKPIIKNFYFFSSQCIRMSKNNINFDYKKIKISDFIKTKKYLI